MTTARENLSNWLRDAYAMEGQAIELLEAQINRLEGYPEALPRLRSHLNETRAQQIQVRSACTGLAPTRRAQGQRHRHARRPSCQERCLRMRPQNPPLCGDGGAGDPARQLLRGSGRESSHLVCGCAGAAIASASPIQPRASG